MASPTRKTTLKSLAAEAGVDVSTVSRALSGDPRVKPETRARICELARRGNYRPNLAARHLVAGRTKTVLFLLSSFENIYERAICQPAAQMLREAGYDLFSALYAGEAEVQQRLLNRLRQGAADGAFLIPGGEESAEGLREFHQDNRPLILIDRDIPGSGAPLVTTDNALAAAELVRRCHATGCRSFLIEFHHKNSVSRTRHEAAVTEAQRLGATLLHLSATAPLVQPKDEWAILSNSQDDVLQLLAACNAARHPLCFGVFDQWHGEPYPAQTVQVAVQDFERLGSEAAKQMLQMLQGEPANPRGQICVIPAKEFVQIRPNF